MKAQALVLDKSYKEAVMKMMSQEGVSCSFSENIEDFLQESIDSNPRIFIIQENVDRPLVALDLIRDLRDLFGSVATIITLGNNISGSRMTSLVGSGADNYFTYPFDIGLIEDFLFKHLRKDIFRPFKYKHVPSGESPIFIDLKLYITEINSNGIKFEADDLIVNGVVLCFDLNLLLDIYRCKVQARVVESEKNISGGFTHFAEFYEIESDLRKRIVFKLKES